MHSEPVEKTFVDRHGNKVTLRLRDWGSGRAGPPLRGPRFEGPDGSPPLFRLPGSTRK
jgi:hypothetical protein